ncbi:hypothetical protein [Sphingomonas asaccharolytica]|uniref:hypothetical protein n=1 Tax=Sphingomonas asaccharolytica TaxID=40681 RepID=UPI00082C324C|nr:hypothetical protein [Sphingomonas asaccharolytica]
MNLRKAAMLGALGLVIAAPAAAADGPDLQPAPQATIVAGAEACLGSTIDPSGQTARFAGWTAATPDQKKGVNVDSDGIVVHRDNVMIAFKTGTDGGCVVMATAATDFDPATFYPQISTVVGARVQPAETPTPITLPDGEIFIPVISPKTSSAAPKIILVFANSASKFAKKGN